MKIRLIIFTFLSCLYTDNGISYSKKSRQSNTFECLSKSRNDTILKMDTIIKFDSVYLNSKIPFSSNKIPKTVDFLTLSNYPLDKIPLKYYKNIYSLRLNYNTKYKINATVFTVKHLSELWLHNVQIPNIKKNKSITLVDLNNCDVQNYDFLDSEKLDYISLGNQNIKNWYPNYRSLRNLDFLELVNCKIEPYHLKNIKSDRIILSYNNLNEFPKELSQAKTLELWLDCNNISVIPEFVYKMKFLSTLSLRGNPIKSEDKKRLKKTFGNRVLL